MRERFARHRFAWFRESPPRATLAMLYTYFAIAGLSLLLSVLLGIYTFENHRFAASRRRRKFLPRFAGRAAVLAPCKGAEPGLEQNIKQLFAQDYPEYELIFVVESANDPAATVIRRLMMRHRRRPAKLIVAGRSEESGQKVHNLRMALEHVSPSCEVFAFVDSDAQPRSDWLSRLVSRLGRADVGAVTGYRWFVPDRLSVANCLLHGVNALVACIYGPGGHYLIWGGSWAIRRDVFDRVGIRRHWRGRLLDDLLATSVIKQAGLRVEFEPHCVCASRLDTTLSGMFEFMRRQYLFGRVYAHREWLAALIVSTFSCAVFWSSTIWAIVAVAVSSPLAVIPTVTSLLLLVTYYIRAGMRYRMAIHFLPEHQAALDWPRRIDFVAAPVVGLVNTIGLISSLAGRTMMWRGNQYLLFADGRARLLGRQPPAERDQSEPFRVPAPHFVGAKRRAQQSEEI